MKFDYIENLNAAEIQELYFDDLSDYLSICECFKSNGSSNSTCYSPASDYNRCWISYAVCNSSSRMNQTSCQDICNSYCGIGSYSQCLDYSVDFGFHICQRD